MPGELSEGDLKGLLADPRMPEQRVHRGDDGFRHVLVWRLVAQAEAHHGPRPDLESELDALVERVGGRRIDVVDPWRWAPDLIRRLRGRALPPRDDVYAIPEALFEGRPPDDG
jgi:hypothetical protein